MCGAIGLHLVAALRNDHRVQVVWTGFLADKRDGPVGLPQLDHRGALLRAMVCAEPVLGAPKATLLQMGSPFPVRADVARA